MISKTNLKKVAVLGLSFKSGTDDLRYSPSVELVEKLLGKGYEVNIYDENVNLTNITGTNKEYIDLHIPHLSEIISGDLEKVVDNAEVIVITQNNSKFTLLSEKHPSKQIIDFVRIKENTPSNTDGLCW